MEYQRKIKLYNEQLTSEQQTELLRLKEKGNKQQKKRERNRQNVELGKPKKFATAFFLYKRDQKRPETVQLTEWSSVCAQKWTNLSENDKKCYNEESDKQKTEYM